MTRAWRRETIAYEDDRGRYWEEIGNWEEVDNDVPDWFDRLDPWVHTVVRLVIAATMVYVVSVILATAWCINA